MRQSRVFELVLVFLVAGCPGQSPAPTTDAASTGGPSTGGTASTTTVATGTTSEDDTEGPLDVTCTFPGSTSAGPLAPEPAPECACIDEQGALTCLSELCPSIRGSCSGFGLGDECPTEWTYNEAALDCALIAARDGVEGTLRWHFDIGISAYFGFLHIIADRRAIRQDREVHDLSGQASDTEIWELREPQYFQGCIEMATFCERLHCFFSGTSGASLSMCLPGFSYDAF